MVLMCTDRRMKQLQRACASRNSFGYKAHERRVPARLEAAWLLPMGMVAGEHYGYAHSSVAAELRR